MKPNITEDRKQVLKASKMAKFFSILTFFTGGLAVALSIYYNAATNEGKMTLLSLVGAVIVGLAWYRASVLNRISREIVNFESVDAYAKFVEEESGKTSD